ncbi:MAG: hypothetical protein WA936_13225 [Erythrobacter sp.]
MSRRGTTPTSRADAIARGPAWPFALAGLAALAVAAIRTVLGEGTDLAPILAALDGTPMGALVQINWYALSAIMAGLGIALLWAIALSRPARRAIALIAGFAFGVVTLLFMGFTWATTGSPFAYMPWLPLTLTTVLCLNAARSA